MLDTQNIHIAKNAQSKIDQLDPANIEFGKIYSDHQFVIFHDGKQWINPKIEPYQPMSISPASPAVHYGISIFEGLKAYKHDSGKIAVFRPDMNIKRLNRSAERMCMPQLPEELYYESLDMLLDMDRQWVPSHPNTSLYIRPFLFSDDDFIGIRPSEKFRYMVITCPVGAYYAKPVKVKIEDHYVRAVEGGSGYCKTGCNYGPAIYPAMLAKQKGYDQLLWTDGKEHKYIEESGTMNVMFVMDDTLVTPALGDTILNGITRDSVLTLARDWGMKVEERKVEVAEIIDAIESGRLKEAFGAGTAATIAHIETIGYGDKDYQLPAVEKRTFAPKVLKTLDDIKAGHAEDTHGWLRMI
jgi:branched-chain amino acid aminotransferase